MNGVGFWPSQWKTQNFFHYFSEFLAFVKRDLPPIANNIHTLKHENCHAYFVDAAAAFFSLTKKSKYVGVLDFLV